MKKPKRFELKTKYILGGLSVVCGILLIITVMNTSFFEPVKNAVASVIVPVQKGMNHLGGWFSDKADALKEMTDIKKENDKLKKENYELTRQNMVLTQQSSELERLRELYKLDNQYADYPKIAARVIGKETGNWFSVFTIDKGSDDGITKNMNVIADEGLVGYVSYVGKNYSKVTTIINDDSNVSAKFASNSEICIVHGDLLSYKSGLLDVTNIQYSAQIKDGDALLTSYISDRYLPGILIGYVSDIKDNGDRLTKSAKVSPVVDFGHLEEVLVITRVKESIEE